MFDTEATSIHNHLTEIPLMTLLGYISERCSYYEQDNPAFDRERFIAVCVRGPEASVRKEPRTVTLSVL